MIEHPKQFSVSYAITVCNEQEEFVRLFNILLPYIETDYISEIVILYDKKNGSLKVESYLDELKHDNVHVIKAEFNDNFAEWKNILFEHCNGEFIIQLDADELVTDKFITYMYELLSINENIDVIRIPRINTVSDITPAHIQKWRWNVNELGYINFPDWQGRAYRNNKSIRWKNKVHEVLSGYKFIADLTPGLQDHDLCIKHPKSIERQEIQNNYYSTL